MGRLWNRLLSLSVAPMLIADIGGIRPPPPKSPCPSAPNRPTSTTIRPQDPNRQPKSLTAARDQAQGCLSANVTHWGTTHHMKKQGAKNTSLGTVRVCAKELWPETWSKCKHTCIKQKPEGWLIPPWPSPKLFRARGGCTWACAYAHLAHQDGRLAQLFYVSI